MGQPAASRDRSVVVVTAGVLAAVLAAAILASMPGRGRSAASATAPVATLKNGLGRGPLVGRRFPPVSRIGLDGKPLVVKPGTGRPTLIVVWSSDCTSCEAIYRAVEAAQAATAGRANPPAVVGVSTDTDFSKAAQSAFASVQQFSSFVDAGGVAAAGLGVASLKPGVLVLDDSLRVTGQFPTAVTAEQLESYLRARFR